MLGSEGLDHLCDFNEATDMTPLWSFVKAHI